MGRRPGRARFCRKPRIEGRSPHFCLHCARTEAVSDGTANYRSPCCDHRAPVAPVGNTCSARIGRRTALTLPPGRERVEPGPYTNEYVTSPFYGGARRGWTMEAAIGLLNEVSAAQDRVARILVMFSKGIGATTTRTRCARFSVASSATRSRNTSLASFPPPMNPCVSTSSKSDFRRNQPARLKAASAERSTSRTGRPLAGGRSATGHPPIEPVIVSDRDRANQDPTRRTPQTTKNDRPRHVFTARRPALKSMSPIKAIQEQGDRLFATDLLLDLHSTIPGSAFFAVVISDRHLQTVSVSCQAISRSALRAKPLEDRVRSRIR